MTMFLQGRERRASRSRKRIEHDIPWGGKVSHIRANGIMGLFAKVIPMQSIDGRLLGRLNLSRKWGPMIIVRRWVERMNPLPHPCFQVRVGPVQREGTSVLGDVVAFVHDRGVERQCMRCFRKERSILDFSGLLSR